MLHNKVFVIASCVLVFLIKTTEAVDMKAKTTQKNPTVVVTQPSQKELQKMGVMSWPIWSGSAREYPASYPTAEWCYFLEGELVIQTSTGENIEIKPGDLAIFQKGLKCIWLVNKPVRKHYKYKRE